MKVLENVRTIRRTVWGKLEQASFKSLALFISIISLQDLIELWGNIFICGLSFPKCKSLFVNHAVTMVESSTASSLEVEPVNQEDKSDEQQTVLETFNGTATFIENVNITVTVWPLRLCRGNELWTIFLFSFWISLTWYIKTQMGH